MRGKSKRYFIKLNIGIPFIFFGLTVLTAVLTYYLTLYYINSSISLNKRLELNSYYLLKLQFWIFIIAIFSFLCGLILIFSITNPINKLLLKVKNLSRFQKKYWNFPISKGNDDINNFYTVFDEVLSLLKTNLKEKDLKEAKPLLDRVKRSDQLAAFGLLAANMAHEIRNPLGSILGLVQLMEKDFKEGDVKKNYVNLIVKSIERLNKLVEELLEFARPHSDSREPTDINKLVKEASFMAKQEFTGKAINVLEKYQKDLPFIQSDRQRLHQAFLNILRNTFLFSNEGGNIHIQTLYEDDFISILFFNTGSYIPEDDLEMIFLPFFTTRKNGIGLGLCIANHTISTYGGSISVKSDKKTGTTFIVKLPIEHSI